MGGQILDQVIEGSATVGIGQRIQVEEPLRDRVNLTGAKHVILAVAGERRRAAGVWLIKLNRPGLSGEAGIQDFAEVALAASAESAR